MNDKIILMSVEKVLGVYCEDYSGKYVPSISLEDYKLAHDIQKEYRISVDPYFSNQDDGWWSFSTDTSFFIDDTDIVRGIFKTLLKIKGLYHEESNNN